MWSKLIIVSGRRLPRSLLIHSVTLALVILPLLVSSRSVTTTPSSSSITMRWTRPCVFHPQNSLQQSDTQAAAAASSVVIEELPRSSDSNSMKHSLNAVASKATQLKDHVVTLKGDYVRLLFC